MQFAVQWTIALGARTLPPASQSRNSRCRGRAIMRNRLANVSTLKAEDTVLSSGMSGQVPSRRCETMCSRPWHYCIRPGKKPTI